MLPTPCFPSAADGGVATHNHMDAGGIVLLLTVSHSALEWGLRVREPYRGHATLQHSPKLHRHEYKPAHSQRASHSLRLVPIHLQPALPWPWQQSVRVGGRATRRQSVPSSILQTSSCLPGRQHQEGCCSLPGTAKEQPPYRSAPSLLEGWIHGKGFWH